MLSLLTWGSGPLQKVMEKIEQKATIRAALKVCNQLRTQEEVYTNYVQQMFASGCVFATRQGMHEMKSIVKPGTKIFTDDEIDKIFHDHDSLEWDHIKSFCMEGGARYNLGGYIKEGMVSDLEKTLECSRTAEYAEKMGIKDVQ